MDNTIFNAPLITFQIIAEVIHCSLRWLWLTIPLRIKDLLQVSALDSFIITFFFPSTTLALAQLFSCYTLWINVHHPHNAC
jgi:hypothetical protein